ncbi:hypothetical protein TcCL_Unassigned05307, partial [Trypanosoma cruzi]
ILFSFFPKREEWKGEDEFFKILINFLMNCRCFPPWTPAVHLCLCVPSDALRLFSFFSFLFSYFVERGSGRTQPHAQDTHIAVQVDASFVLGAGSCVQLPPPSVGVRGKEGRECAPRFFFYVDAMHFV